MINYLNYFSENIAFRTNNEPYILSQIELYKTIWTKHKNNSSCLSYYQDMDFYKVNREERTFSLLGNGSVNICWDVDGIYLYAQTFETPRYTDLYTFQKNIIPFELIDDAANEINTIREGLQYPVAHQYSPILIMGCSPFHTNLILDGRHRYVEYEKFNPHAKIPYYYLNDLYCLNYIMRKNSLISYVILYNTGIIFDWIQEGMPGEGQTLPLLDIKQYEKL